MFKMTYIQPLEVVKNVLVQVKDLIFPVDFYILNMDENVSPTYANILH